MTNKSKVISVLFFLLLTASLFLFFKSDKTFDIEIIPNFATPTPTPIFPSVQIDNLIIPVDIATTTEAVIKGLSGRPSLGADIGLLFIFQKSDIYQFWMPNMFFPIDIIWIDSNYNIIGISKNATEKFDSKNPVFYKPSKPIRFVLEVNAGFSDKNGINVGDKVLFNSIKK